MAYTTINKPSATAFNTKLYTGNGGTQSIDVGFQSDFTWLKSRTEAKNHVLIDAVRGSSKNIHSNLTNAEDTNATRITGFDSDGFNLGSSSTTNTNSQNYVSWNWKANGAGSANTAGSINSTVSANTTSGFSIVSWTGTGANATVGHGLGVAPKVIIIKNLIDTEPWIVYHTGIDATAPEDYHLRLNTTDARVDEAPIWNDTAPTSSVFSLGSSGAPNGSGDASIAYCFADVQGFSKFGSYQGNNNVNGTFVYTGFKPAFVMIKLDGADGWMMLDNKRDPFNVMDKYITANGSGADTTRVTSDFVSNGFKLRTSNGDVNNGSYIYMAFAEAPLVGTNNVPCTAR
jgi:hypothetical protein